MAERVNRTDAKHLFGMEDIMEKPVKKAFYCPMMLKQNI